MSSEKRFTKHNSSAYHNQLLAEAEGLNALRQTLNQANIDLIGIPNIYACDENKLTLDFIESGQNVGQLSAQLGEGLARLHQIRQSSYGWPKDNFIGLNPQYNRLTDNWGDFFIQNRLKKQIEMILDSSVRHRFLSVLDKSEDCLRNFLNQSVRYPSLVHGDLWSGNVIYGVDQCWLIDPAVYYADSEVDLAMTEMFGGFSKGFYDAYQYYAPLSEDYPLKKQIYNGYHYLNHYNLFGSGYLSAVEKLMKLVETHF